MISNKEFIRASCGLVVVCVALSMFIASLITCNIKHSDEQPNIVDSKLDLIKSNDSLKLEVNNLDSIKNAKVIEVQNISNDSTVKLFYELVKGK